MGSFLDNKYGRILVAGSIAAVSAALFSTAAYAETPSKQVLTAADLGLTDAQIIEMLRAAVPPKGSPGISMGSPVGFGASWGSAGVGIGGATAYQGGQNANVDGSVGGAMGFGDASSTAGLEVSLNVISLRNNAPGSGFGDDGNFGLKLHKAIQPDLAVSIGEEGAAPWGAAKDVAPNYFAAITKIIPLEGENRATVLAVNFGVGKGRFDYDGGNDFGAFGSVAWIPHEKYSLIADWSGRDLALGVSVAPLREYPLSITLGAINVAERLGQRAEFSGGIGYGFSF